MTTWPAATVGGQREVGVKVEVEAEVELEDIEVEIEIEDLEDAREDTEADIERWWFAETAPGSP